MKRIYLICTFLFGFGSQVFAGNGSQGGPPPLAEANPLTSESSTLELSSDLGERLELNVTPADMLTAIDAAMQKKDLPFTLDNGKVINLKPQSFDFARRELKATIKGLDTQILLREISSAE